MKKQRIFYQVTRSSQDANTDLKNFEATIVITSNPGISQRPTLIYVLEVAAFLGRRRGTATGTPGIFQSKNLSFHQALKNFTTYFLIFNPFFG